MATTQIPQNMGRAKNLIQEYFIRKLLFPKVYLDVEFNGRHVDVLAVDRFGAGDVHTVNIVYSGTDVENALETAIANSRGIPPAKVIPHFIYTAIVNESAVVGGFTPSERILTDTFAEDGIGRIGILYVDLAGEDPSMRVILKSERFRSSKEIVEITDQFVAKHTPNWEVRESRE